MVGDDAAQLAAELNRLRERCFELAWRIAARERALGRFPDARPATVVRDSHAWYIRDGRFHTTQARTRRRHRAGSTSGARLVA
jgi:hypothetical protein